MSYKLLKPYTNKEYCDFVVEYNHNKGMMIQETDYAVHALEPWEYLEGEEVKNNKKEWEQEQIEAEKKRIDNLTVTALDFICFLEYLGLTLEQINTYIDNNLEIKMQLTYCQNVYCGVAKGFCPIELGTLTLTADMVEIFFKYKNGEIDSIEGFLPRGGVNDVESSKIGVNL